MGTLSAKYFDFKKVWESVLVQERPENKLTEWIKLTVMRLLAKQTESTVFVTKTTFSKKKFWEAKAWIEKVYKIGQIAKQCFKKCCDMDGEAFMWSVKTDNEVWL